MPDISDFERAEVNSMNANDSSSFRLRDVDTMLKNRVLDMLKAVKNAGRTINREDLYAYFAELYEIPDCVSERVVDKALEEAKELGINVEYCRHEWTEKELNIWEKEHYDRMERIKNENKT